MTNKDFQKTKEKGPKIQNAKAAFIDKMEVYLPLGGMIDIEKEKKRIKKDKKRHARDVAEFYRRIGMTFTPLSFLRPSAL